MRARLLALQGARQARRAHSTARPWLLFVHGLSGTHANGRSTAAASRAVFSYAVHPQHLLVRLDRLSAVHPMDDALTMSLKAMLRHACGKAGRHRCRRAQLVTGGVAPL